MGPPQKSSPVIVRLFITVWVYMTLSLGLFLAFICQIGAWILLCPIFLISKKKRILVMSRIFYFFTATTAFYLNPFWYLKVVRQPLKGYEPSDTILMVNHLSGADPWIVSAATFPWVLKYIYKSSLKNIPIGGWALALSGEIPIYFTKEKGGWGVRPGYIASVMKKCKELQEMKIGQVVFPEGTRSKTGCLQQFRNGFFRFAIENNCEILPCVLHNSQRLFPLTSYLMDYGTAYFAFGTPVRPLDGETVEELKKRVKDIMISLLKECPTHNPLIEKSTDYQQPTRGQGL